MNIRKLLIGIVLSISIITCSFNISYASDISSIVTGADDFMEVGSGDGVDETKLKTTSNLIYKILAVIGISVAVVMTGILGIRFMMGSTEEKAQVKEQLIPFITGCIVIFGAFSIWSIVVNIGNSLDSRTSGGGTATTPYTRDAAGNLYCGNCGDQLSVREQHNGRCLDCNFMIEGI